MSDEITIEVDGRELKARKGEMLIEVTDKAGIYIPRFCYHEKLSVAANCRMCLVEMENGPPKPLPACATPVADGNKFKTRSTNAIAAQRATMEFLLINHPLDCPICDQGGECELQDLAMGYGRDISRYTEKKRVVKDKNLGPLVSTDMTRCIHCTRCVRFGEEIAGIQELGTLGRGEDTEIGTYVERSVDHEMSGNIIDLCPVGALNSKPARYSGRSWEFAQIPTIAPHDSVGSNLYAHVRRGKVMRVVPKPTEEINETWISDRDRFSYTGIYAEDRLESPMVRTADGWKETDWATALTAAAEIVSGVSDPSRLGMLVSPVATLEEQFFCASLMRKLGSHNVDHRLRTLDFSRDDQSPVYPSLGLSIEDIERQNAALIVGCDVRREAPIVAHRLRKAALAGGHIHFINPPGQEYLFDVASYIDADAQRLCGELAALVEAAGARLPQGYDSGTAAVGDTHRRVVESLKSDGESMIMLGHLAQRHSHFSAIRAFAHALAGATGARFGYLPEAANSVGAWLAGSVPHRLAGGQASPGGRNAAQMMDGETDAFVLFGVEPEVEHADRERAAAALEKAKVISLSPFASEAARNYADVLLPIGTFAETAGTFVNLEGRWQSFTGVANPVGQARPGWKVLRVLAEQLGLDGFAFNQLDAITAHVREQIGEVKADNSLRDASVDLNGSAARYVGVPMYDTDALVRRAVPLQNTAEARSAREAG